MSCEKNRGAFVAHVAGGGSAAAQAFGGANDAGAALETIFDTARAQAAPSNLAQQTLAAAKTRLLFEWMKRSGFTPPTHSPSGLPKADAQFGYAAMYDTIAALRDGKALPALAAQIVDSFGQTRALSAIRVDAALAQLRCGSCGRFAPSEASGKPPHFCPNTATPETFQRALIRRLGVPPGAYPTHRLAELLAAAKAGSVPMRHPVTNEPLAASLDSLPLALTQGFVPDAWQGDTGLALIAVSNGRIAPVLDATGLTRVALPETMLAAAAVGSGTLLALARSMLVSPAPISATMITAPAAGDPPTVRGGTAYDAGRFIGTEFRKSKGTLVTASGHTYTVGDRSDDPADWGLARREGIVAEPPTRGAFRGIAVGRTLVAAAEILRVGSVIQRADQVIELYTNGALVSLYDPATRTAGDVAGTANASPEQMAAVLGHYIYHRRNDIEHCLMRDRVRLADGDISPLAFADSAYLAIKDDLDAGTPLTLGGAVSAAQCPECGRYMGAAGCRGPHVGLAETGATPVLAADPDFGEPGSATDDRADYDVTRTDDDADADDADTRIPPTAPVAVAPVVAPAIPPITVNVEAPQVTVESPTVNVAAPTVTVNLDPDALARGVAARMPTPVVSTADGTTAAPASSDPRIIDVLERLVDRMEKLDRGAAPAPALIPVAVVAPALAVRADRPVPAASTMTAQEKIVTAGALRMPRPDRALTQIDRSLLPAGFTAIDEAIPTVKIDYVMNDAERRVLQRMVSVRSMGSTMGRVNETRSFGIYGPPGTGKNELARQFAASMVTVDDAGVERQGVHFEQVEFDRDMDTGALIGTTALENGSTVARLGPIGLAAVQGSVICLNEVVRNPKALTQFQSMIEEGEIRIKTPEAGIITIPIHPATTFVQTWNPGLEGDSDRPAEAPRSRTISLELPAPTAREQVMRVNAFFSTAPVATRPTATETNAAIAFFSQVRTAITQGTIQQRGRGSKAMPGPRDLNFFILAGKTDGWSAALHQLQIFGDQNPEDRDKDWKLIEEAFRINFGSMASR